MRSTKSQSEIQPSAPPKEEGTATYHRKHSETTKIHSNDQKSTDKRQPAFNPIRKPSHSRHSGSFTWDFPPSYKVLCVALCFFVFAEIVNLIFQIIIFDEYVKIGDPERDYELSADRKYWKKVENYNDVYNYKFYKVMRILGSIAKIAILIITISVLSSR